ncbi:PstS family phosphate ABC transporter substrate-binding protein [Flavobacterium restrictum]|uniref:Phosphate ABC transporter substrate-binding protein n=1 Tax=Flavobacterium restrictum TaxID=2594428 RepID=A0A553EBI0_9FLAO|nr:substrate-binding domain-containing protein [Flavobacterium restrictum]TRX42291.1 phosphate ABC transporter substrate-binding protein [Flavobacterium restrictum]
MFKKSAVIAILVVGMLFITCKESTENKETILKGSVSIIVDETLLPIIQDQVQVFESTYDAKITLIPKSESEALNALFHDKSVIAILARDLTKVEKDNFLQKKIIPKTTLFASDAIAFISNKSSNDTLVAIKDVVSFMNGNQNQAFKGLVFDNPNSSTVRYMNTLAGLKTIPSKGVFSLKTNDEVIKFVAQNKGMIGVVGVNWLSQPQPDMQQFVGQVAVMSVKGMTSTTYQSPSQNSMAEGTYPLARDLYIINCQGYSGLGMGFASFVAGDIGQRIILKSGLLPVRVPNRKLMIRNKINNDKK